MAPSSKCEFPSSPVHIRTLRIMCPLLSHSRFRAASSGPDYQGDGPAEGNDRFPIDYPRQMPPGPIAEQCSGLSAATSTLPGLSASMRKHISRFYEAMTSFIRFSKPTEPQPIAARRPSYAAVAHSASDRSYIKK